MCDFCNKYHLNDGSRAGRIILVNPAGNGRMICTPTGAQIHVNANDEPAIMFYKYNLACGYIEIEYCPMCGERLCE
jgi:hypothetical protein